MPGMSYVLIENLPRMRATRADFPQGSTPQAPAKRNPVTPIDISYAETVGQRFLPLAGGAAKFSVDY